MKQVVKQYRHFVDEKISKISWLVPFIARISVGIVFAESGWGKLHNLEKVIGYFESLGIPYASLQAPFVSTLELVGGTLILLGLFTRLAALPLVGVMVVALLTAKAEDISQWSDIFGISEFLYIVILVGLVLGGAGAASGDAFLKRHHK